MDTIRGEEPGLPNRLWQARKRRGLGQKQVATLLGYKQIDQLSRFELGRRVPSLRHALMLEIIYGVPVRLLFDGLSEEVLAELREQSGRLRQWTLIDAASPAPEAEAGFCAFQELLRSPLLTAVEQDEVRSHITRLARALAYL